MVFGESVQARRGDRRGWGATRRTLLLSAAAALPAAACAPKQDQGAAGDPGRALGKTPVSLSYVNFFQPGDPQALVLPKALEALKQAYPQIAVDSIVVPNAEVAAKLQTMVAGGTPPDAAAINPRVITQLYTQGILADLEPYLKRDAKDVKLDDFFPATMTRAVKQGKHYALPLQMGLLVLAYNKSLFGAAGVPLPDETWTWDTYADAAKKLTRRDLSPVQFGGTQPEYEVPVWAWGSNVLDQNETRFVMDQPAAVAALQWRTDLRNKHRVSPLPEDGTQPAVLDRFIAGQQAMFTVITGNISRLERAPSALQWDLQVVPKGPAKRATLIQGPSIAVIADSRNREAAWQLVKTYEAPEVQRFAALEAKVATARRSATEEYVRQPGPYNRKPLLDSAAFAVNQPFVPQYDEMNAVITAALTAVENGEKSVQAAMQEAKPKVDAILSQGR